LGSSRRACYSFDVVTRSRPYRDAGATRRGFTLIELLVTIAIITLLTGLLLPALGAVRQKGRATRCLSNLHVLGHGIMIYVSENKGVLMPSRLPKFPDDSCNPYAMIFGRRKYRPTAVAIMSTAVGVPPFADPRGCKNEQDIFGQPGDQQDYAYAVYVCPSVSHWVDERNGSYGWNYHFLGNSRLRVAGDASSGYKNWPVRFTSIRYPARTVAMADCMGTAASFPIHERREYVNNGRGSENDNAYGNEGFNLDPPRVDPVNGEMAGFDESPQVRTALHARHSGRGNVLWLDGHVSTSTLKDLGYKEGPGGGVEMGDDLNDREVDNSRWTGSGVDLPWTYDWLQ